MKGSIALFQAIIKSAVADGDLEYIRSQLFEDHCFYLGIEDDIGLEAVRSRCIAEIEGKAK